jgi:hypothetical protein
MTSNGEESLNEVRGKYRKQTTEDSKIQSL